MADMYFEDYAVGRAVEVGKVTMTEAEIIDFARRYDPQDFHVDPAKAAHGPFGGIVASGWHTAAAVMRPLVDHYLSPASSLGSPGLEELRWLAPVRPGDVLTIHATVTEARRSGRRPDRGVIHSLIEVTNQDGVLVMTMKPVNLVTCRDGGA
ncbi:MAG: MaoC family dehydratase [Hyphomicrobiales bacterium]|nr:MaoC family dehydratase [Hyphomicrobiales bacterium]MCP5374213.1 MaoC family dehydratase [Hyphomicrobiales bacterium]